MKIRLLLLISLLANTPVFAQNSNTDNAISTLIQQDYPYLDTLYKHLHANPELSLFEHQTAARIAEELRQAGYEVTEQVGGYGVVGLLRNGDGPTVMIRADMDALPVKEETGLPYASTKTQRLPFKNEDLPVMHACGHDIHMSVMVGTARLLAKRKADWQGTLMLIGQPAEERGLGAFKMLQDGLFERFPRPDYNLTMHVNAEMPAGQIAYTEGYAMANVDSIDITVKGIGGHGAYPHKTRDPVVLAAQIVMALQTVVSREVSPLESAVVTVGAINGGNKHNVIPEKVHLQLTVRSYKDEVRAKVIDAIRRIAIGHARMAGLPEELMPEISLKETFTPSVYNNPELTSQIIGLLIQTFGSQHIKSIPPVMAGEDFSRYGREKPLIPSLLLWLGSIDPAEVEAARLASKALPSLHSSQFKPLPQPTIETGVEALSRASIWLFNQK